MTKMNLLAVIYGLIIIAVLSGCTGKGETSDGKKFATPAEPRVKLVEIADELTSPVYLTHAGDGSNRLFIVEQPGIIKVIKDGKILREPFLDISKKIVNLNMFYDERGLLGLVFHPGFKTNGRFFVYYSAPSDCGDCNHKTVVAEYNVSPSSSNKATIEERILMTFDQPESNHNGGQLEFGPDGFLYIGSGDGGGGGDKHGTIGNGQDTSNLLGKILRIDVNGKRPYAIPPSNPFVSKPGRDEIWAYGLRNPWRFSFDKKGRLFCGDVGQNKYEEVNIIEKGKNYGWRIMEGFHCYNPPANCDQRGLELPVDEYDHSIGISVTGGYVYEGKKIPWLAGKYIFGDWSGDLFILTEVSPGKWKRDVLFVNASKNEEIGTRINSFGIDEAEEIYIITQKNTGPKNRSGIVFRIEP